MSLSCKALCNAYFDLSVSIRMVHVLHRVSSITDCISVSD